MSRRRREQQSVSPPADHEEELIEDHTLDDELARELEEERQKILAAAGHQNGAQAEAVNEQQEYQGDDGEMADEQDADDEDDLDAEIVEEEDNSEDEWQPPEPASRRSARRSKRRRHQSSSEDGDDDALEEAQSDQEPALKKSNKTTAKKPAKAKKANGDTTADKTKRPRRQTEGVEGDQEEAYDSFHQEAERVQAEVEAAAAWADVRRRKEAGQAPPSTNGTTSKPTSQPTADKPASAPSLTAWLGKGPSASSSLSELAASLPMPTTCKAAQIVDRNSLFVGYVYPLTNASSAYISALLSHITRVVHPTVPTDLLPPQFANAPANKRGSSHDMYAYRVFKLKRGRTGLAGPDDFSLQEDKEDDGERWGGDRVLKVARDEGASDVLVIVSRWYGGELLGPVRFDHIENAARAALQEHMGKEEVEEFRQRIQHLDQKIARIKAKAQRTEEAAADVQVDKYRDLTMERAQRLWLARQKALAALQNRWTNQSMPPSQVEVQQAEDMTTNIQPSSSENEAVLPQAESSQTAVSTTVAEAPLSSQDVAAKVDLESTEQPAADEPMPSNDATPDASPSTSQANVPTVKPEPPLTSLDAPIRVKDEEDTVSLPLATDQAQTESVEEEEDDKSKVKLEPTEDDDGPDLTGWDDLS
ncbi:hypothetical protein NDA10_003821 [Ustilago hordei]|uniref:Impact N-terminal domain-containing protein n=1 Tax=Ustilago hordei TaxID=120017 RepID=I2FP05_USTHO|nr:uncharacterized protein UHO2_05463 [Ustilago hordei]KAJ1039743.1 hypothetical protein NDA10_003821 [Ustilago hordei]UTT90631.1 hypothetical protein NDA17_006536 [Ustilago hordei]CCF48648.1 uncharacterized protein UHOR_06537 [Ustilago hordei]SYW86838.1 uncharacterized protein UHO2_05463 [Ustilago hordei]